MKSPHELRQIANRLRLDVLRMAHTAGSGHIGGSFSAAEIITVLYEAVLRPSPERVEHRDRFVLSKGHAAPALYCALANKGVLPHDELLTLRSLGGRLQGHPCMFKLPGVDMSTGSLGMGISVGVGMALAARQTGDPARIYVLCGDGELQEGQNWEALMSAFRWKLNNLVVIVDHNHVQLDGTVDDVRPQAGLRARIEAFGLHVVTCDGHDPGGLLAAFGHCSHTGATVILAETVKGKGVSFMEGQSAWHGKPINDEQFAKAVDEIKAVLR